MQTKNTNKPHCLELLAPNCNNIQLINVGFFSPFCIMDTANVLSFFNYILYK